jgi:magnesium chelatase accessory protein
MLPDRGNGVSVAALPASAAAVARVASAERPVSGNGRLVETPEGALYVELSGSGRELLLLHGTGAAGHSWRHLVPRLAERWRVVVPDLPGHGRSPEPPLGYHPRAMTRLLTAVVAALDARPALVLGHSAGTALGAWLLLEGRLGARGLVAVAPAMLGFRGLQQSLFSNLAKLMAAAPLVPDLFAWRARDPSAVRRLLEGVGSRIDEPGVAAYGALLRRPSHVQAVLSMMAQWELQSLQPHLPELADRVLLVTGDRDRAVPAEEIRRLQRRLPGASHVTVRDAGHLLHEERPLEVLAALERWVAARGIES